MINKSEEYKSAIVADSRKTYVRATINLVSPDIVYGKLTGRSIDKYSKPEQLYDREFSTKKYTTLEKGRWKLDEGFSVLPDDAEDITGEVGAMSVALSGSDGTFATAQYFELAFSGVSVLQAASICFPENSYDGLPVRFKIDIYQGGTVYFTKTIENNTSSIVKFDNFTVYNPDKIRVTAYKMNMPDRRFRVVEIIAGIFEEWSENDFAELNIVQQVDLSATSLPFGTCILTMDNESRRFEPTRSKSALFESIEERQAIPVQLGVKLADGSIDYTNAGVYYQYSGGWKTGNNGLTMQWSLVDILGLLAGRKYIVPNFLEGTLKEWVSDLVSQLGVNFAGKYKIASGYQTRFLYSNNKADLESCTCGDIARYLAMAVGCFIRADNTTGNLAFEPLPKQGNIITLDNITNYPTIKANEDIALVSFTLATTGTVVNIGGTRSASSKTISVKNPFIHTTSAAMQAAQNILALSGGNAYSIIGRGDMSSECGDVDSIQLDESSAVSARRIMQEFNFSDAVMKELPVELVQSNGFLQFEVCEVLTTAQTWTAPNGVNELFVSVIGGGNGGKRGSAGDFSSAGTNGEDGAGGLVWYDTISINNQQKFTVKIGAGGSANGGTGSATTFGTYTSANGERYEAYTDIRNGKVYARPGVEVPLANTGNGGKGGKGGKKGNSHTTNGEVIIDNYPTAGANGVAGASGCVVIWYAKPTEGVSAYVIS